MQNPDIYAEVLEDTISGTARLTTLKIRYHRMVHAEFLRHRTFCLAGDNLLDFDLPSGTKKSQQRLFNMSLAEFATKWKQGAAPREPSRFLRRDVSHINPEQAYSVKELSRLLGLTSPSNLRLACRTGELPTLNPEKPRGEDHILLGKHVIDRYTTPNLVRQTIRPRLQAMRIRQVDENSLKIQNSHVVDVTESGIKPVYVLQAGGFKLAASLDHRVLTTQGWKRMGDLQPGVDYVICKRRGFLGKDRKDPSKMKLLEGVWRDTWQKQQRPYLYAHQKGICPVCTEALPQWGEGKVHTHHIVPVHVDPSMAFDLSNLQLLHARCHHNQHKKQGWQGGTYLYGEATLVESIVFRGEEMTYDLEIAGEFPNFLANGVVVHNSRGAASSRAIPVIKMAARATAEPLHWGLNQTGMQASTELTGWRLWAVKKVWRLSRRIAQRLSRLLAWLGAHKQIANRITEPYQWMEEIISGTDWDNFFNLRAHAAAQPEIRAIAEAIRDAMAASTPRRIPKGDYGPDNLDHWHLPFITTTERVKAKELAYDDRGELYNAIFLAKLSAARCARVSYLNHDGSNPDTAKDLGLFGRLTADPKAIHASPMEHQAYALASSGSRSRNYRGWRQFRAVIEAHEDE